MEAAPRTASSQGQLRLRVLDAQTESPVPQAKVTSEWTPRGPFILRTAAVATDSRGECRVSFGPGSSEDWRLLVRVIADGYVPRLIRWGGPRGDQVERLPAEYTLRLVHGLPIGGRVVNERGEPVPGAQVSFGDVLLPPVEDYGYGAREGPAPAHVETTDERGFWRCTHLPSELEVLQFSVSHPDYLPASFDEDRPASATERGGQPLNREDLLKQTAVIVLKPGLSVSGVVRDYRGQSLAGAEVIESHIVLGEFLEQLGTRLTGAEGRFRFSNVAQGDVVLSAQADGFAAESKVVHPAANADEVDLELNPTAVLRGRVVDQDGRPVVLAHIVAADEHSRQTKTAWPATDEQGKFFWPSAPPTIERYDIWAPDCDTATNVELAADATEHLITLHRLPTPRKFRLSGSAIDRATRAPIAAFEVWMGRTAGPTGTEVEMGRTLRTTGSDGRFLFLEREQSLPGFPVVRYLARDTGGWLSPCHVDGSGAPHQRLRMEFRPRCRPNGLCCCPVARRAAGRWRHCLALCQGARGCLHHAARAA